MPDTLAASKSIDLSHPSLYTNRELSWLEFNQRVLDQAIGDDHPLLERVKFLAIVASNLDEFFMVRVATLLKKQRAGLEQLSLDGLSIAEQLRAIRARAAAMVNDQANCWQERLRPFLLEQGVRFLEPAEYSEATRRYLSTYFRSNICPLLTPLAFDPGHPFPLISNLSKNLAVVVRHKGRMKFARVKVPDMLPRFVKIPAETGHVCAFVEDVIRLNLSALFPQVDVLGAHLFRIIRDTDIELREDGADDLTPH